MSLYTHVMGAKILFVKNNENDINKVFSITLKTPAENKKAQGKIKEFQVVLNYILNTFKKNYRENYQV